MKKRFHRCLSICLLLLFHTRGLSVGYALWMSKRWRVLMCLLREVLVIDAQLVLFKRNISRCQLPQYKKKETNTEQCRRQRSLAVDTDENIWRTAMHPIFWRWITSKIYFFLSSAHSPLHHSIPYEFSHPCCPSQGIFPSHAVQTLVPFSGNNWSVGWSCCACTCFETHVLCEVKKERLNS